MSGCARIVEEGRGSEANASTELGKEDRTQRCNLVDLK
jgi:hypothetical protein